MKKLLLLLAAALFCMMTYAEVTLFSTNFSIADGWSTESIITSTTTSATRTIKGTTISFKGYKTSDLTVAVGETDEADGTLTFVASNVTANAGAASGANFYMAIPVSGVNGGEVTVTTTGDATKWYYTYDDGSNGTIVGRQQASANGGFTITGLSNSSVTIYIGNNGKKLNSITITTPDPSALESIAITGNMTKTEYYSDDDVDYAGLGVEGTYDDESTEVITAGITWSIAPALAVGTTDYVVTAVASGFTATKNVTLSVSARPLPDPADAERTEDGYLLLNYEHAATTPNGIFIEGTTVMSSVKIKTNSASVNCIQLKNGYTTDEAWNGNAIKLAVLGGFKAGDVVTISGFFNNADNTKEAKASIITLDEDNSVNTLFTTDQFTNGRLVNDAPNVFTYTLEADAEVLYIGRVGNTAVNIYTIKVVRPAAEELTPFQQALKAIEESAAESVEFTAILVSVSGTNYVVKEETTAVANPAPMKRIAAEDAEPTITLINPTVLNTAGNEPTEAGTRVAITGTTDATGIINGTIKGVDEKGWATGVDNTEAQKVEKIFRNGQVVIIKNGVEYNVLGAKL